MQRRMPDITKLQRATGWQPAKNLTDIIREVGDHLKAEA
jgi:nucleoside-diphosphate-sugar epimerase